jgi:hypothetical protein
MHSACGLGSKQQLLTFQLEVGVGSHTLGLRPCFRSSCGAQESAAKEAQHSQDRAQQLTP